MLMLRIRKLFHNSTVNSTIRFVSNFGSDEAWKLAVTQKSLLGSRTMILTDSDEYTKELGNRMGFEMRRNGIEPVFCTMSSPYPNHKIIEESLELLKRTGSKSIISIGSGAVVDMAKSIRLLAETGTRKMFTFYKDKPIQCKDTIPLISVATSVSHVHTMANCGRLHAEDDVLVKTWCRSPEVVVYDPSVIEKVTYHSPEVDVTYVASLLFDCLFSIALQLQSAHKDAKLTPEMIATRLKKVLATTDSTYQPKVHQPYGDPSMKDNSLQQLLSCEPNRVGEEDLNHLMAAKIFFLSGDTSQSLSALCAVADKVGCVQSRLQLTSELHCSVWPGLTEISALLLSLNVEGDLSLPYSWRATEAFSAVMETLCDPSSVQQRDRSYRRPEDKMILSAVDAAFTTLTQLTGLSYDQLAVLQRSAASAIVNKIKKTPKRFRRPTLQKSGGEYQTMTPAGHVEKVIAVDELEEADAERAVKAVSSGDNDARQSVFEEEEKGKRKTVRSILLKSDVMLDLVEKMFAK